MEVSQPEVPMLSLLRLAALVTSRSAAMKLPQVRDVATLRSEPMPFRFPHVTLPQAALHSAAVSDPGCASLERAQSSCVTFE